jgi:DNA replication protein DnaC
MTTPDTQKWLAGFKTRHGLELPLGADLRLIEERTEMAAEYAEERTPPRYAGALPSVPEVEEWAAAVVRAAVTDSQARGQQVASVHAGPSLLLLGPTGVGKTHEAYGAMRAISLSGVHARWVVISAADLYARLRPRHGIDSEAEFAAIAGAEALAVDDIGAAKNSDWVEEVNFRLVNRRYELALPSLFTSNLPAKSTDTTHGLDRVLGERVVSRLREMTTRVSMKGSDRRRAA